MSRVVIYGTEFKYITGGRYRLEDGVCTHIILSDMKHPPAFSWASYKGEELLGSSNESFDSLQTAGASLFRYLADYEGGLIC